MKIDFETPGIKRKVTKLVAEPEGHRRADKLRQRLKELEAVTVLCDLVHLSGPRFHQWTRKARQKAIFSVDLDHPMRLLFVVKGEEPELAGGGVDLAKVDAISLLEITDPH